MYSTAYGNNQKRRRDVYGMSNPLKELADSKENN